MPSAAPPEVKVDVAVVGAPFLDLTFEGLTHLPALREEVIARKLHVAPGGTGMQALGAARLGLTTALVAPMGRTSGAGLLRGFLETEGVEGWAGPVGAPIRGLPGARTCRSQLS
jgi:ribokinase